MKTIHFYRFLILSLSFLITGSVYQVLANSTCSSTTMILVGATDFSCTYDYGEGQMWHELENINFYGTPGAAISLPTSVLPATDPAQVGTAGRYAIVKNPSNVTGKGYPNINESMIILRWAGSDADMMSINVAGLNTGAPVQVKIWGYYLSAYGCSSAPSNFRLAFNVLNNTPSPAPDINFPGTPGLGVAFSGTSNSASLRTSDSYANISIRGNYYPNNCGVVGITRIEVYACPDIVLYSLEGDEVCAGEQTRITLDRDYRDANNNPYPIVWEKSTTSATTGFTAIPGTTNLKTIMEEMTQSAWYRCKVANVVSSPLAIKTMTCCESSTGAAVSRKIVYHETFGVFTGPNSYIDALGVSHPELVQSAYCARLPAAPGAPTGVQNHDIGCPTDPTFDIGKYHIGAGCDW